MTTYNDYKLDDIAVKNFQKESAYWSAVQPVLALSGVTETGGTVILLTEDGLCLIDASDRDMEKIPVKTGSTVTCALWHPKSVSIVVGWASGEMGVYSLNAAKTKWTDSVVKLNKLRAINCMKWISDGLSLVTVDVSGMVTIWNYDDNTTKLTEKFSQHIADQITDMAVVKASKTFLLYFGTANGVVYQMISETESVSDVIALDSAIKQIIFYNRRNRLIIITDSMLLCQYSLSISSAEVCEVSKVKLSSNSRNSTNEIIKAMMIDDTVGLIAVCVTGERVVRLWQLESGHNAAVIVAESADSHWAGVTSVDYCNGILVAGTSNNHVIVWKRSAGLDFNRVSQLQVKGSVKQVCVGKHRHISCITSTNDIYLINEQNIRFSYNSKLLAVQNRAKQAKIMNIFTDRVQDIRVDIPIRCLFVSTNGNIIGVKLSGTKQIDFYRYSETSELSDAFCSASITETDNMIVIHDEIVWSYLISADSESNASFLLVCYNLNTNSQEENQIELMVNVDNGDTQLRVIAFEANRNHLIAVISLNSKHFLYTFKLNSAKHSLKSVALRLPMVSVIMFAKVNIDGSMVALIDNNNLFVMFKEECVKYAIENDSNTDISALCWAENERRLLCFTKQSIAYIMLCSDCDQKLIKLYDKVEFDGSNKLVTFNVPNIYFLRDENILKQSLYELDGLNDETISVMLDFLTAKDFDLNQMIKRINQIGENNSKLWMNLARLSVKSRDIQMGLYCASKLQNARVVRDVKQELNDTNDTDLACAVLAMNLKLYAEAEDILKKSGNKLRLSKYYQDRNEWEKAIECVDRVNQKTVLYSYAKHLEHDESNITEAIKHYEKSGTHVFEVPRMLFDVDGNHMLRDYCLSNDNKESMSSNNRSSLQQWWGQYCESLGDISEALDAYETSKDYYNLVRLLCYTGETDKAKSIINGLSANDETSDQTTDQTQSNNNSSMSAAMLHLGRHFESLSPIESISYYLSCGAIKHAIRVCKANQFINELIKITITYADKEDAKRLVSQYALTDEQSLTQFDISDELLVQLYYKCGLIDRAIECALRSRVWTQLRELLSDEIANTTAEQQSSGITINEDTLALALDALNTDSDIIDIVIDLLLLLKSDQISLMEKLVADHNIEVNEKLVEKVSKIVREKGEKQQLMLTLADLALQQGNYLVAAKLYNNEGMRANAIKALIRAGEVDKIVNYANIARDKGVYKIAANYLQTMNYGDDSLITNFYRKAGAKQELERFSRRDAN